MTNIAIIPARGGSKRIPHKNIKEFLGKPMISYAIAAARQAEIFDHIVVSTDSQEIAKVAQQLGAEIYRMRPKELSDDFTGTGEVTRQEVLYLDSIGIKGDYICTIYATVPLIEAQDLKASWEQMTANGKQFAYALCSFEFPIWRGCYIQNGSPIPVWPENMPKRSQDLPEVYHDAGQFYWAGHDALLDTNITDNHLKTLAYLIPRYRVVDIDTPEDWINAEMLYKAIHHHE